MQLYSKEFVITGGCQKKTFLGMQVEQIAQSIKIRRDHYIKEVLAEYAECMRKVIRPKKVPTAPNLMLSSGQKTPLICRIPVNRSSTALLWQNFSSQPHGSDSMSPLLCHSWLGFAHRLDLRIGQHFTTSWNTWQAPQALSSRIDEARVAQTCCRATPMQIGGKAVHGVQR